VGAWVGTHVEGNGEGASVGTQVDGNGVGTSVIDDDVDVV
jgi:hypothetical protein